MEREEVPVKERQAILHAHSMGHIETNTMVNSIHGKGKSWPKLAESCTELCTEFIKKCRECQRMNIAHQGYAQ